MKILCFGTFARVLKFCRLPNVTDIQLIGALTKTIDPFSEYGESEGTAVSRLLSCTQNLSNGQKRRTGQKGVGNNRTFQMGIETNRLSNVVQAATTADRKKVEAEVVENVIPLIDEDKKKLAISVLLGIIKEDTDIDTKRKQSFVKFFNQEKNSLLGQKSFILSDLFTSIILYTIISVKNTEGKQCARSVDKEYVDGFKVKQNQYSYVDTEKELDKKTSLFSTMELDDLTIKQYMSKLELKYSKKKPLLYSQQPKPFYDFYVCNDVTRRLPTSKAILHHNRHVDTLASPTVIDIAKWTKYAILTGTGGIGKSMMLRHFLLDAIMHYDKYALIPIFITLKDFDIPTVSVLDLVISTIDKFGTKLEHEKIKKLLESGKCVILLDGLDEISTRLASTFEKGLDEFIDCYPLNQYIISSRPYKSFISYDRFSVLSVEPFSKEQAIELIDRLEFRTDEPEIKAKFRSELDKTLYKTHREFTENPLLLTIMLMTFEQFAEVPSKMHIFYREAFIALSKNLDASKGAYKRNLKTGLTVDKFADYFAEFCSRTYHDEKFELTEAEFENYFYELNERSRCDDDITKAEDFLYDLCTNVCLMYMENGKYHFVHRSFQEYFCALYFSRQKDRNLLAIGQFFEEYRSRNYGDKTFMMLYDMIPAKVDEYIFIPFLEKLINECDNEDGYWTFLSVMYPVLTFERGETAEHLMVSSASYIYEFIKKRFFNNTLDLADLPFDTSLVVRTYGYKKTENQSVELVNLNEISGEYTDLYGMPTPVGWVLQIDVGDLRKRAYKYKHMLELMNLDSFVLKKEYIDVRKCLEKLRLNLKPKGDSLFDLFR